MWYGILVMSPRLWRDGCFPGLRPMTSTTRASARASPYSARPDLRRPERSDGVNDLVEVGAHQRVPAGLDSFHPLCLTPQRGAWRAEPVRFLQAPWEAVSTSRAPAGQADHLEVADGIDEAHVRRRLVPSLTDRLARAGAKGTINFLAASAPASVELVSPWISTELRDKNVFDAG